MPLLHNYRTTSALYGDGKNKATEKIPYSKLRQVNMLSYPFRGESDNLESCFARNDLIDSE